MKKKLKVLIVILSIFIAFGNIPSASLNAVDDSDFENNGDYYSELCAARGMDEETKNTCRLYSDYLARKVESIQQSVDETKSQINTLKSNITQLQAEIKNLQGQVDSLNMQIADVINQIDVINNNILMLQGEINLRIDNIDNLNKQIMERMANIQPFVSLNKYIEFIMGASDFTDLLRRTGAINEIMDYDVAQIKRLEEEKKKLEADKAEQDYQRAVLAEREAFLEQSRALVQDAMEQQNQLMSAYMQQANDLEVAMSAQQSIAAEMQAHIESITANIGAIVPSSGWIYPVPGSFYISGGCPSYFYPNGGATHFGVDFATSIGTNIMAIANGVVAFTHDGEAAYGYLGNYAGYPSGGGNTVALICSVNGATYGVFYYHLLPGIYVSAGQVVSQGDVLGRVGSSGNSTGSHVHVDMYYLGDASVQQASAWLAQDLAFGAGWTMGGFCDSKGVPCRLNPQGVFNVYYGFRY